MATANTYLKVTDLDFEDIRDNLKTYLSTQTQFRDYNFEGSAMAVLLDVLAYNTHYNAYYVNMLANEMFLDTAQQRDSVVSHAKLVGYTPTSAIGASANVEITFTNVYANTANFTIPKNSTFSTTVDDVTYTYVTPEAFSVVRENGLYVRDITIKEGEPLTHKFTVTSSSDRFILPNENVDQSSITVTVQESSVDTSTEEFLRATNIDQIYSTSAVYFLEEAADKKYEIVFGNGTLGKALKTGNIVIVEYLVNNGDVTNGADTFSVGNIDIGMTYGSATITNVNSVATGGHQEETVESIKFNAPRNFQTQNRAVVKNDYERIILAENLDIESVTAFGGEEAVPAVYGKVYVAVKPFEQRFATRARKERLRNSIFDRTPLGVEPVIIDPEYTYIVPTIKVYYNATRTTSTLSQISEQVKQAALGYSTNNLERFGKKMRYSRFVRALDDIQNANILNSDASIQIQKRFAPELNINQQISLYFHNAIRKSSIESTQFTYDGFTSYFDDDGVGNIRIFRFDSDKSKIVIKASIGTIDYDTGEISISDFGPSAFVGTQIRLSAVPANLDVIPVREQILLMEEENITVEVTGEYQ